MGCFLIRVSEPKAEVFVKGDKGYVIAQNASEGVVLVVLTSQDAKLGLVFLDMRRAIEQIGKVI